MKEIIQLDFTIEMQKESRLCWAAVSISIARFYQQENLKTQVEFAKSILGTKYNQFYSPTKALSVYDNLLEELERPMKLIEIIKDLENNRPIVTCMKYFVGWHLVVIYGIDKEKLLIADPMLGYTEWEIDTFIKAYHKNYSWVYSYRTKKVTL